MGTEIERLNVVTQFITKYDQSSARKAERQAKQSSGRITSLFTGLGAKLGAAGIGIGFAQLGKGAIQAASEFETVSQSFEILIGDVERAKKLIQELDTFSLATPFQPKEIQQSAKTLLGFGRSAEVVLKDMELLGNASAATGADLQSLAVVYGQVAGLGKLQGGDALQFVNQGLPIYKLLEDSLGKSTKELKVLQGQGKITFADLNEAFRKASAAGGRFEGALVKQSKTLAGLKSTGLGVIQELAKNFGNRLLPSAKGALQVFIRLGQGINKLIKPNRDLQTEVRNTQRAFNQKIETLKNLNPESKERAKLIDEINTQYKDYLPSLLSEKDSYDKLAEAQEKANTAFEGRILLIALEEELKPYQENLVKLTKNLADAERETGRFKAAFGLDENANKRIAELNSQLDELYKKLRNPEKFNLDKKGIEATKTKAEELRSTLDKIYENRKGLLTDQERALLEGGGKATEQFVKFKEQILNSSSQKIIQDEKERTKKEIADLEKLYEGLAKKLGTSIAKIRQQFSNATGGNTPDAENDGKNDPESKKIKFLEGSIADLNAKIKASKELINSTNEQSVYAEETRNVIKLETQLTRVKKLLDETRQTQQLLINGAAGSKLEPVSIEAFAFDIAFEEQLKNKERLELEKLNVELKYSEILASLAQKDADKRVKIELDKSIRLKQIQLLQAQTELNIANLKAKQLRDIISKLSDPQKVAKLNIDLSDLEKSSTEAEIQVNNILSELNSLKGEKGASSTGKTQELSKDDRNAKIIAEAQQLYGELINLAEQYNQKKKAILDRDVTNAEKRYNDVLNLQEGASQEQIDIEKRRLDEAIEKREAFVRKEEQLAKIAAAANILAAIARVAAETGPASIATIPLVLGAIAAGIGAIGTLIFHEGTEFVDQKGKRAPRRELRQNEVNATLEIGERVLTTKQNARLKNVSNDQLVRDAEIGYMLRKNIPIHRSAKEYLRGRELRKKLSVGRISQETMNIVIQGSSKNNDVLLEKINNRLESMERAINSQSINVSQTIDARGIKQEVEKINEREQRMRQL